jgi:hypothetical protein
MYNRIDCPACQERFDSLLNLAKHILATAPYESTPSSHQEWPALFTGLSYEQLQNQHDGWLAKEMENHLTRFGSLPSIHELKLSRINLKNAI